MEEPLNPQQNQDPLEPNHNPFEDPLFDALEHSIENPPDFVDPLIENNDAIIDDLAKQLEGVEASIENTPPMPPQPTPGEPSGEEGKDESNKAGAEPGIPLPPSTPDIDESSETSEDKEDGSDSSFTPGQQESSGSWPHKGSLPKPPRRPYGDGWRQAGHPPVHGTKRGGRSSGGKHSNLRYCPDSRELIDEDKCSSCEKYRHWPEGTDEEPRECWYDWQAIPPSNESDDGTH